MFNGEVNIIGVNFRTRWNAFQLVWRQINDSILKINMNSIYHQSNYNNDAAQSSIFHMHVTNEWFLVHYYELEGAEFIIKLVYAFNNQTRICSSLSVLIHFDDFFEEKVGWIPSGWHDTS